MPRSMHDPKACSLVQHQQAIVQHAAYLDNTRDVLSGNGTALDLRHKLKAHARFSRFKSDSNICKLARATRLLLVDIPHIRHPGNGLTVVDLQFNDQGSKSATENDGTYFIDQFSPIGWASTDSTWHVYSISSEAKHDLPA